MSNGQDQAIDTRIWSFLMTGFVLVATSYFAFMLLPPGEYLYAIGSISTLGILISLSALLVRRSSNKAAADTAE